MNFNWPRVFILAVHAQRRLCRCHARLPISSHIFSRGTRAHLGPTFQCLELDDLGGLCILRCVNVDSLAIFQVTLQVLNRNLLPALVALAHFREIGESILILVVRTAGSLMIHQLHLEARLETNRSDLARVLRSGVFRLGIHDEMASGCELQTLNVALNAVQLKLCMMACRVSSIFRRFNKLMTK